MTFLWIFLVLCLLAMAGGLYGVLRRHATRARQLSAEDKALVHVQWHTIEQHLAKGGPTNFKSAVIEGDKLVDYCLKELRVPGDTMGDRMRAARGKFTNYEGLWAAHKLRNQLVHEVSKDVHSGEAKTQVGRFKTALEDLGAL